MKRGLAALLLLAALALAAGCGDDDDSSGDSGGGGGASSDLPADKGGEGAKVAHISPVASQPNQQQIYSGLEKGAQDLGWETKLFDANLSPDKQVAAVDTIITQGFTAFSSGTLDPNAAAGPYERALGDGIPVIGMNSEGQGVIASVWSETLGPPSCEPGGPGDKTAEFIAEKKPGGKVIVVTFSLVPPILQATECFEAAAKKAGLEIIERTDNTGDTAAAGQKLMQDLLTKYPDVDAMWNYNDASALGASAAIGAAGKTVATGSKDGIVVLGNSGDAEGIAAVKAGRLTGVWDPDNVAAGMALIKQMQAALKGGVDKSYPALAVKAVLYTSENIDQYTPPEERDYTLDNIPLVGE
jgi:ribose transport system substrate-binding protein